MKGKSQIENRIAAEGMSGRLKRHASELLRLAAPIAVSRSGFLFIALADAIAVGRYSSQELAYFTIAYGLIMPVMITAMGMIMGTLILTANRFGAEDFEGCGEIWQRSIFYAFVLGVPCIVYGLFGEGALLLTGQTEEVASQGGEIMAILGYGMPGHLLFLSSAYFLEGIGRPTPAMIVMIFGNILNVGLNWIFVDGGFMGADGGAGAAWATTISRLAMAFALAGVVWSLRDHARFGLRKQLGGGFGSWMELRRVGYAIGVSIGVESLAFATLNVFAGWMGEIPLAAYGLTLNVMALVFMLAIGFGSATAVRVGIAYGRGDFRDAALAGWTGIALSSVVMVTAAIMTYVFNAPIAGIYTDDPVLLAEAFVTVAFIAWVYVPDGGQAVMANALRGRKDVWTPSIIQTASFFGVMVPVGYVSAFVFETGAVGLFHGIFAGCLVSLAWLSLRFHMLSVRDARTAE